MSLKCFLFMKSYQGFQKYGAAIYKPMLSLKKLEKTSREMTTALFLLRSIEIGISVGDLDLLTIGMMLDMWTEKANDDVKYQKVARQREFDKF